VRLDACQVAPLLVQHVEPDDLSLGLGYLALDDAERTLSVGRHVVGIENGLAIVAGQRSALDETFEASEHWCCGISR